MKWEKRRPGRHRGDTILSVQRRWHACCASTDGHRFDCPDVPPEQRGLGPFGPLAPATPRQLVDLIRQSSIGAGLHDIKTRGIDAHLADLERELHPRSGR